MRPPASERAAAWTRHIRGRWAAPAVTGAVGRKASRAAGESCAQHDRLLERDATAGTGGGWPRQRPAGPAGPPIYARRVRHRPEWQQAGRLGGTALAFGDGGTRTGKRVSAWQ
ncbi:hypothetical protein Aca07nite_37170 [Actinoplanes capillaceus]|uniref:Uncharacterized protein n=1 Tax=Actinoplanes campanulatus TaxID=113559 RepID=A0ABQ3WJP0_9ACTN|nr:hypothetical protein Aca07nite_37170 [Actinoplanes capillaceus]